MLRGKLTLARSIWESLNAEHGTPYAAVRAEQATTRREIMRHFVAVFGVVMCAWLLSGCTSATLEYRLPPGDAAHTAPPPHSSLKIPAGHLPPPGSCRIWFPGTPPGQQSPPGDCEVLARNVPSRAWLLHRPSDEPRYVDVSVYDPHQPGVVVEIRIFDAANGTFVGIRGGSVRR